MESKSQSKYFLLWDLINVIPDVCYVYGDINTAKDKRKLWEKEFTEVVFDFADLYKCRIAKDCKELVSAAKEILERLISDPLFGQSVIDGIINDANSIIATTKKNLDGVDVTKLSNQKMFKVFDQFYDLAMNQFYSGRVPMILEVHQPYLANHLKDYLKTKIKDINELNEVLNLLMSPDEKTIVSKEETNFLKIADKILSKKIREFLKSDGTLDVFEERFKEANRSLDKHYREYFWIPHDFTGPVWEKDYFYSKLLKLAKEEVDPKIELSQIELKEKEDKKKKIESFKKYRIDQKHKKLFEIAQGFMFTKPYRKERFTYSFYCIYRIYHEIAARFDYSLDDVRWMTREEKRDLLVNGLEVDRKELAKRNRGCVMISQNGKTTALYDQEAEEIRNQIFSEDLSKYGSEIKGTLACLGAAKGKVKLIFNREDISKMKEGDILVAPATNPDVVPAMKMAGAIVTDAGGLTSHAAVVSRELGVPCIIGTKVATKVLKEGDLVEVDAEKEGLVKIIKN